MIAALLLSLSLDSALFDDRIRQAMKDTGTPSLAVAVVKEDAVIYQRTFNAGNDTRFYLASVPKSMTGLTLALLAHERKIDLDAPLTTTLPRLQLPPPLDPSRMALRDLLTHRLGFENDAIGWRTSYSGEWTDDQLFAVMQRHTTVSPRVFSYDNLGFILATYAAEHAAGRPWQQLLTKRVLSPVGIAATSNVPCIPTKSARTMNRGAGGLCSTLPDMVRWLRVNMSDGVLDGMRVFPERVMRAVHAPQISLQRRFGRLNRFAYGLGWYHADYEGDLVVHHFGSYPGAWAHVSWMPDRRLGVVVLANAYNPLPDSVAMLAYDALLGRETAADKFEAEIAQTAKTLAGLEEQVTEFASRHAAQTPDSTRTRESYAGTYVSDAFGTMTITHAGGTLHARIGDRSSRLTPIRGDAFYARWFATGAPSLIVFTENGLSWDGRTFVASPRRP